MPITAFCILQCKIVDCVGQQVRQARLILPTLTCVSTSWSRFVRRVIQFIMSHYVYICPCLCIMSLYVIMSKCKYKAEQQTTEFDLIIDINAACKNEIRCILDKYVQINIIHKHQKLLERSTQLYFQCQYYVSDIIPV